MQENKNLKDKISKYLDKRPKNTPTRLDSTLRSYVKGELDGILNKYPFIIDVFANLPSINFCSEQNANSNHKKKVSHKNECAFFELFFEKDGVSGEIIFFDDYYEYYIFNDNNPEEDEKASSFAYSESNPIISILDKVWNEVSELTKSIENSKNETIKKRNKKYKAIYYICYGLVFVIAVGVIIYNRNYNNSKALWFLLLALVPTVIGSYCKYKTLDKK